MGSNQEGFVRKVVLVPECPKGKFRDYIEDGTLFIYNCTYRYVIERCGGILLESVEVKAFARYEPLALEFLLSRLRRVQYEPNVIKESENPLT